MVSGSRCIKTLPQFPYFSRGKEIPGMHPPCDRGRLTVERFAHGSSKLPHNCLLNRQQQLTPTPRADGGVCRTTCGEYLAYGPYRRNNPSPWVQERVLIWTGGDPIALVWEMVDDFLVHAPT
jgi:hypothetical protein